jgi:hypothetical protein
VKCIALFWYAIFTGVDIFENLVALCMGKRCVILHDSNDGILEYGQVHWITMVM